jgi:hypothetical protein
VEWLVELNPSILQEWKIFKSKLQNNASIPLPPSHKSLSHTEAQRWYIIESGVLNIWPRGNHGWLTLEGGGGDDVIRAYPIVNRLSKSWADYYEATRK